MVRYSKVEAEIVNEAEKHGFSDVVVSSGRCGGEYKVVIHSEETGLAKEALFMVGQMLKEKANAEIEHAPINGSEVVQMYFKPEVARREPGFGVWYEWNEKQPA